MAALDDYVACNRAWSNQSFVAGDTTYSWDHSHAYGVSVHLPRNPVVLYVPEWLEFAAGADWTRLGPQALADATSSPEWGALVVELVHELNPL